VEFALDMPQQRGLPELPAAVDEAAAGRILELAHHLRTPEEHLGRHLTSLEWCVGAERRERQGAAEEDWQPRVALARQEDQQRGVQHSDRQRLVAADAGQVAPLTQRQRAEIEHEHAAGAEPELAETRGDRVGARALPQADQVVAVARLGAELRDWPG